MQGWCGRCHRSSEGRAVDVGGAPTANSESRGRGLGTGWWRCREWVTDEAEPVGLRPKVHHSDSKFRAPSTHGEVFREAKMRQRIVVI